MVTTDDRHAPIARRSAVVAAGTLLSRFSGLVRIVAIGAVLGPTFFANIFQAGYALPGLVFTAIAGPTVSMVLVPVLVRRLAEDPDEARRMLAAVGARLLVLAGVVVVLVMAGAPLIAHTLTLGVDGPDARARSLATLIVLLVAPQIVLYTVISLGVAAQQACGRFALATTAPVVENLVLAAVVIAAGRHFGTGQEVDQVPFGLALTLGVTSLAATALHAMVQVAGARRAGLPIGARLPRAIDAGVRSGSSLVPRSSRSLDPATREVLRALRRAVGVAACPALALYALLVLAATVNGGVFVVQLAWTAFNAGLSMGGGAVAVAALPALAVSAARDDVELFGARWRTCLRYALTVACPLGLLMAAAAWPAASLLTPGDLNEPWIVQALAVSLAIVAVIQIAGVVRDLADHALFAHGDQRSPARAGQALLVATLLGAALAMSRAEDGTRLVALVAAMLLGECVGAVVVLLALRRRLGCGAIVWGRELRTLRRALAVMAPGAVVVAALGVLAPSPWRYPGLVLAVGCALGCYVAVLRGPTARPRHRTWSAGVRDSATAVVLAAGCGALVGLHPEWLAPSAGVLVALAVVGLCARTPMYGVLIYLATLPVLAGIERGHLIPLLRPNEAVLVLVVGGALLGATWRWLRGARCAVRWTAWDGACALLGAAAVLWPLLWLLLRGRSPEPIELAALLPVCKVLGLYVFVRATVHTARDVSRCLRTVVWSGAVVATIAVLQTMHVPAVLALLGSAWALEVDAANIASRGSSTLGSPIATGDFLILCGLLLLFARRRGLVLRREAIALGCVLGTGILASGQISTWIACLVVATVLTRQVGWRISARRAVPVLLAIGVIGAPAVAGRIREFAQGQWPVSWLGRWDNLSTFYLPRFDPGAFAFGISPNSVTPAPETWREVVYLESGYLDLLWIGGTPLLVGFAVLSFVVLRHATRCGADPGPRGACAQTLIVWWPALLVLTVLDPHLTLRGPGDLMFVLIGVVAGPLLSLDTQYARDRRSRTHVKISARTLPATFDGGSR